IIVLDGFAVPHVTSHRYDPLAPSAISPKVENIEYSVRTPVDDPILRVATSRRPVALPARTDLLMTRMSVIHGYVAALFGMVRAVESAMYAPDGPLTLNRSVGVPVVEKLPANRTHVVPPTYAGESTVTRSRTVATAVLATAELSAALIDRSLLRTSEMMCQFV